MGIRIALLGAALAVLTLFACARDHAAPVSGPAKLVVQVRFSDSDPDSTATVEAERATAPNERSASDVRPERSRNALIQTIRAQAIDMEQGDIVEESIELGPTDTRFELELAVPSERDYRIVVSALGTRETGGLSTEDGLLYSGFAQAYGVSADEPTVVPIVLENRVPFLSGKELPDAVALSWTEVADATGYRIRETIDGQSRTFDASGLDTVLALPPRRDAGGGGMRSYRVRAELPGEPSAFSEPYELELQGPSAPAPITDLAAGVVTPTSVELRWTAPGDDGQVGQAAGYDIRWSGAPLDESNFSLATPILGAPAPSPAGTEETLVVSDLEPATLYYFALRSFDDVPLTSAISNVLQISTTALDTTPPDPAPSLVAKTASESTLELSWTATGDDGSEGLASEYDLRIALFPLDEENLGLADRVTPVSQPGPAGTAESALAAGLSRDTVYHFALRIVDDAGNGSTLTTGTGQTLDQTLPEPLNLSATAIGETEIRLDWIATGDDGSSGQAALYDLRISEAPLDPEEWETATEVEGEPNPAVAGTPQFMIVTDLTLETPYWFAMRAIDNAQNLSAFSNAASDTTFDRTAPSPVIDLTALADSKTSVHLEWTAPGDDGLLGRATEYELRFADSPIDSANFEQATRVSIAAPQASGNPESAEIPDLETGIEYSFAIRARDNAGNVSALSNIAFATPADVLPPAGVTDLAVTEVGRDRISVTWTAPGDDGTLGAVAGYDLRYSLSVLNEQNFDDATMVKNLPMPSPAGAVETAEILGLDAGTRYWIALRSADDAGNLSPLSNILETETGEPLPEPPTDLRAESSSFDAITLTWTDAANNEDSYEIERREPPSQEFQPVATLPGPFTGSVEHLDSGLAERTQYAYRVRARNAGGASGYSNEATARTAMAPPVDLAAEATSPNEIVLSWTFGTDPDGFRIERRRESEPFVEVADLPGALRTWPDAGLDPLTSYTYRIRGYDSFGSSDYSGEASAMTPDLEPLCELRPNLLDFGIVEAGFMKTRSFEIENVGGGLLSGTVSASCGPAWSIVEGSGDYSLSAGQVHTVRVRFAPPGVGIYDCSIDAGMACGTVECSGEGIDPRGFWASGFGPAENGVNATVRAFFNFTVGDTFSFGSEQLIAGGDFTSAGGFPHSNVAAWNGNSWVEMDGGLPGPVYAFGNYVGQLHAAGSFETSSAVAGGYPPIRIAYWIPGLYWDGTPDYPDNTVRTISPTPIFELLMGGQFLTGGGRPLYFVAEFTDGTLTEVGPKGNPGVNGTVRASVLHEGSNVIGGDFTVAGGVLVNRIAIWTGSSWLTLGTGMNGPVYALASAGGLLYAGGDFTIAGGVSAPGIAVWDGSSWSALDPALDFRPVRALHEFQGEIIAGGSFEIGGPELPLNRIASWNGAFWQPLGHGIGDGEVLAIGSYDGSLFVGGTFAIASGIPSSNVARWAPNISTMSRR